MAFINDNRGTIREHIGRLMYGSRFLKDTISGVGANYVALPKATRFGANHFSGAVLSVVNGAAAGAATYVQSNEPATAHLILSPVPVVMPAIGDAVEVWPDETTPDAVNDAINLAILDVQHLAAVPSVLVAPTLDSARKRITVPATWTAVARMTFEDGGLTYRLRPRNSRDPNPWDQADPVTFDIENDGTTRSIVVWASVPDSASNVRLVGYAAPTLPTDDTTAIQIRSDFITYKAASILEQHKMAQQLLDPEGAQGRATFWAQQAEGIKRTMNAQAMANTVRLEEAL